MNYDDHYAVSGFTGVAFYYAGPELKFDEDSEWTGITTETGMARMVMVGDDREHIIDPADCTSIEDEDYCPECGQIGCTASAL